MYRLGWFSTARGPTSRALLAAVWDAIQRGEIAARIEFVFCSRERGESPETDLFLDQASGYGVPLVTRSFVRHRRQAGGRGPGFDGAAFAPWREEYDREIIRLLEGFSPELVVLAGYMFVMTPALSSRFTAINLHPAAPDGPVGTWQQVIWHVIEQRARESGVRMHLVTPELDQGPIVTYCTYSLRDRDLQPLWVQVEGRSVEDLKNAEGEDLPLFKEIRKRSVARELPLLLATIRAFSEGRVRVEDNRCVDAAGNPIEAYDLTAHVEAGLLARAP